MILTIPSPFVETTLAAGDFDIQHVASATIFYNDCCRARNKWDIKRCRVGVFYGGLLKKRDAEAALAKALAAQKGGAA